MDNPLIRPTGDHHKELRPALGRHAPEQLRKSDHRAFRRLSLAKQLANLVEIRRLVLPRNVQLNGENVHLLMIARFQPLARPWRFYRRSLGRCELPMVTRSQFGAFGIDWE